MTQSPISTNQTAFLGDGNELSRQYESALRVPPAYQRLDAAHLAGRDVDLRLIVQGQLALRERAAQLRFDLEALARESHDAGIEKSKGLAAVALGEVHGLVGARQKLLGAGAIDRVARNADARADVQLEAGQLIGLRQCRHPARDECLDFLAEPTLRKSSRNSSPPARATCRWSG